MVSARFGQILEPVKDTFENFIAQFYQKDMAIL